VKYLVAAALATIVASAACTHPPPTSAESDAVAAGAAKVAAPAPAATFHDASGAQVALADVWKGHQETVVVFYRGFY
jgi:hypothetical protein